jgi:hypothetical protein
MYMYMHMYIYIQVERCEHTASISSPRRMSIVSKSRAIGSISAASTLQPPREPLAGAMPPLASIPQAVAVVVVALGAVGVATGGAVALRAVANGVVASGAVASGAVASGAVAGGAVAGGTVAENLHAHTSKVVKSRAQAKWHKARQG